jgi:hypothetical protein
VPSALALLSACAVRREPPPGANAETIYDLQLCANCHGARLEGTTRGPALHDLAACWSRVDLVDFLADPERWRERDARLAALEQAFSGEMDSYENLSLAQRGSLADWLLAR